MTNRIKVILFFLILCVSSANFELIELNEDNWRLMLEGEWMVEFFAPWCPACKSLSPIWKDFAKNAKKVGLNVAQVDVTKSPSLSGRFLVTALPTIYHIKDGQFRQYRGSRDGSTFMYYVREKEWQKVQPVSSWKNPDSIHMSILSYFFKLSHLLKDFNSSLQDKYGLPTWGSYALLATATIFVGAALGLVLVCIVDLLYPANKAHRQSFSLSDEKSYNSDDDEILDDVTNDTNSDSDSSENTAAAKGNKSSKLVKKSQSKSSPSEVRKRNPKKAN